MLRLKTRKFLSSGEPDKCNDIVDTNERSYQGFKSRASELPLGLGERRFPEEVRLGQEYFAKGRRAEGYSNQEEAVNRGKEMGVLVCWELHGSPVDQK